MSAEADVVVVGGGPAGATAALLFGRAGLRVRLYEQHRMPREKACAEGLMPAGVGVLERLGLATTLDGARFFGVRYHGWGQTVEARFPVAPALPRWGLGIPRRRLDTALFAAAAACPGVSAWGGVRVDEPLVSGDRVVGVRVAGQPVRARLVVAADGPRSGLRRRLGLDGTPRRRSRVGLRAHFRLAPGRPVPDLVEVFLAGGRELYVTPLAGGEVVVAALTARETLPSDARARFRGWLDEAPALAALLAGAEQTSEVAGQAPLESRARAGVLPGLALVGDAAGFLDPVTGSGIAQALISAEALAHALLADGRFDPSLDRLEAFDRRRRRLVSDAVWLTRLALALVERPAIARRSMRLMRAIPALYGHLVAVAGGTRPLMPG